MMRTNAWILIKTARANNARKWNKWKKGGSGGQEPALDENDKSLIKKIADSDYILEAYKESGNKVLISVWDIDKESLKAYEAINSEYKILGFWTWSEGDEYCARDEEFEWLPDQIIKHLPPNPNTGLNELWDVNLLMGQPPRDLRPAINLMDFVRRMESEGWDIQPIGSNEMRIVYNGENYDKSIDYLLQCDFSDLPEPLKDDIVDALHAQGLCVNVRKPKRKPGRKPRRKPRKKL